MWLVWIDGVSLNRDLLLMEKGTNVLKFLSCFVVSKV